MCFDMQAGATNALLQSGQIRKPRKSALHLRERKKVPKKMENVTETQPTKADMVMLVEDAGSGVGTLNTHIKGWISMYETGGTKTWTQATLVDGGDWDGTTKRILVAHDVTLSGTSGTQMAYKITTHSTSAVYDTKIHATSIGWR